MPGSNDGPNGSSDERTPLTGRQNSHGANSSGSKPLYQDDRAWVRYPMNFLRLAWLTLASNYVNVLLVFVPAGIVLGATNADPVTVFVINFIAIIPLASLLSFATEELSVKLGQTIGGLMNATFGNAVELIVGLTIGYTGRSITNNHCRSVSLRSGRARSVSSSPACLAPFFPTSSSFLAAASSPQA
jgi:hypothetical protein